MGGNLREMGTFPQPTSAVSPGVIPLIVVRDASFSIHIVIASLSRSFLPFSEFGTCAMERTLYLDPSPTTRNPRLTAVLIFSSKDVKRQMIESQRKTYSSCAPVTCSYFRRRSLFGGAERTCARVPARSIALPLPHTVMIPLTMCNWCRMGTKDVSILWDSCIAMGLSTSVHVKVTRGLQPKSFQFRRQKSFDERFAHSLQLFPLAL
jgi:hypothetical protein